MAPQPVPLPLDLSPLGAIADELCARLPGAARGDFTGALVLLPSARACRTLGHLVLERAGNNALLLPRILTPNQLAEEAATALGVPVAADAPGERTRALILTHALVAGDWLQGPPETAPGLAQELVRTFDEIRRHQLADLLLLPTNLEAALARMLVREAEAESVATELRSLHDAWRIYRACIPHDRVDAQVQLANRLEAAADGDLPWPGRGLELAIAAGFTRLEPVTAAPMRAALAAAVTSLVMVGVGDDPLSRRVIATWDPQEARGGPLGPARRAAVLLGADAAAVESLAETGSAPALALRERLDALAATLPPLPAPGPGSALDLRACGNAENEARVITDMQLLRAALGAFAPPGTLANLDVNVVYPFQTFKGRPEVGHYVELLDGERASTSEVPGSTQYRRSRQPRIGVETNGAGAIPDDSKVPLPCFVQ